MKSFLISAVLGAVLVASALPSAAPAAQKKGATMSSKMSMSQSVTMKAQNNSGETGTATLKDTAKGVVVTIHIKGAKGPQPAHIHKGSCAKLDPKPEYPLHNVINGMSITTVPGVTIAKLSGKTAINVHKSLTDIPTYVSCGDIGSGSM